MSSADSISYTFNERIEELKRGDEEDYGYEVSAPLYDEVAITKSYVHQKII